MVGFGIIGSLVARLLRRVPGVDVVVLDINDDKLVRNFGRQVGTPDALRRLYLLTYADMRATGPKVWNGWKGMLLAEAYLRVQESFARGLEPEDRAERIGRIRERVLGLDAGGGLTREDLAYFLDSVPPSYMLGTPEVSMPQDALLVRSAGADGIATRLVHAPAFNVSELTVATVDRPGLFATITGVVPDL